MHAPCMIVFAALMAVCQRSLPVPGGALGARHRHPHRSVDRQAGAPPLTARWCPPGAAAGLAVCKRSALQALLATRTVALAFDGKLPPACGILSWTYATLRCLRCPGAERPCHGP
jgi:hypothetical protein